jgi:hypothetical protein
MERIMSKWYQVDVEIWKRVVVEVEDHETDAEATDAAYECFLAGKDGQIGGAVELSDPAALDAAKRHADETLTL